MKSGWGLFSFYFPGKTLLCGGALCSSGSSSPPAQPCRQLGSQWMALLCLLLDAVCCGQPCSSDRGEKLSSVLAGNSYSLGLERRAWVSQGSSPSVPPSRESGTYVPLVHGIAGVFLSLRSPGAGAGSQPKGTRRTHSIPKRHLRAGLAFPPQITLSVFAKQDN